MLNKIIYWSITNKLIVAVLTVALIVWGIFSLNQLPIDAVPDITNNQVQIVTSAPSSGAEDIERYVTFPVEQTMATIPGIEEIRSFSRFGLSVVTVVFTEETDIYWARQQVSERLNEAKNQIPPGFGEPGMAPLSTGLGEIYQYIIKAKNGFEKKYDAMELRTIQDWIIRRQLLGVPGVADVSGFGGELKQYQIALDPVRLRSFGLTLTDVFRAIEVNNQNTGGAYIERHASTTYIRTEGLLTSIEDIKSVIIKQNEDGTPVLVQDVATVALGPSVRYGALTYGTSGEAVGGIVLMLKGANSSKVIEHVKERMEQIKSTLPAGVEVKVYLDRTKLVNNAIHTVSKNLIEGALIVIFVLVLLLGNFRAGLIVASVIPLAMLFAISLMNVFGVSGNLMSLGALDFGLIIDGAVIIVESTLHILYHKGSVQLTREELNDKVYFSASKFAKSAVFGQIIILVVYLPLLALVGIEGKMFKPMAQTVMFAILGALILSLTYVPVASAWFLNRNIVVKESFSDRLVGLVRRAYEPILNLFLRKQRAVLLSLFGLLAISMVLFTRLGAEFIPSLDEGDFAVETRLITGTSLTKTLETTSTVSKVLLQHFPEVKEVVGKIGTAEIPTDPMPMEACDLMIILKDKEEWVSADTKEELAEKMQAKMEEYVPGVSFGFQQPIQMRFNELMTGAKQDVVVKIYGEDLKKLGHYADQVGGIASHISGVQDVYIEQMTGLPQLIVAVNRNALARYNISVDELNRAINTGFSGQTAGLVFEGERRFDLVVKLDSAARSDINDLRDVTVTSPLGVQVPIDQLAEVRLDQGPNQIQRDDAKRRIIVGFNVRGRDVESIVTELKGKLEQQVKFEAGYYPTYGGTFKNLEHARARLSVAVPVALFLIFFLLYLTFQSLKQAALIFTAIPLAAVGGIISLWIRDMPFSISAGVGFIALFGVAVLNGIVLISEFNALRNLGHTNLNRVVLLGTRARLRPVLLTALVASLGFLPMALSHGSGAEVQKPLATVVIGGLITATLLTLFVLPILYLFAERKKKPKLSSGIMVLLFTVGSTFVQGQQTLQSCLELAKTGNKRYQLDQMRVASNRLELESQIGLPKSTVGFMIGQYNSFYSKDNSITMSQQIPFPTQYGRLKSLAELKATGAGIEAEMTWKDVELSIKNAYSTYQYLLLKRQKLRLHDSLLAIIEQKMLARLAAADAIKLDVILVQTNRKEIESQQVKVANQLEAELSKLKVLVGQPELKVSEEANFFNTPDAVQMDATLLNEHPYMQLLRNQVEVAKMEKKYELARSLPDITLGYINQTLTGDHSVLGQNKSYTTRSRFQVAQVGLDIPIFVGIKKTQELKDMYVKQREFAVETSGEILVNELELVYRNYSSLLEEKAVFEENLLPQTTYLLTQYTQLHAAGEAPLIDLIKIREQVIQTEMNYLDLLNNLMQSKHQLEWYLKTE